jgi:hypothetical protein
MPSEETVNFALYIVNGMDCITEMESVYCAVRTRLITHVSFVLKGLSKRVDCYRNKKGHRKFCVNVLDVNVELAHRKIKIVTIKHH